MQSTPKATDHAAHKFDAARAAEYDRQSRIALAGYEACHELTACMLAAVLGSATEKSLLIVGAGTGQEIVTLGAYQPRWRFVAVDPSPPMLAAAEARLGALGLLDRTELRCCALRDIAGDHYDGATLIGVLHHLKGDTERTELLQEIAARLQPGAPLVLAGNYRRYDTEPLLLAAWKERWRLHGASAEELEEKFAKITQAVEPPASAQAVLDHLSAAGFVRAQQFFTSLFWGAWIAQRA